MTASLRYRGAPARRAAILELLSATGYLGIREVADRLMVSEMTARRDIQKLVDGGEVSRVRGGIRVASVDEQELTGYERRVASEPDAKTLVGRAAATLVSAGDAVAIDAGTTAFHVAANLPPDFHGAVVSHSIPVIDLLSERPQGRVTALGGDVFRPSRALVGSFAVANTQRLRVSTFFLGAAGVDEDGIYVSADVELGVKRALMQIADRVVLVVDHGKFSTRAPVLLCGWTDINTVICNKAPRAGLQELFESHSIDVLVASSPAAVPQLDQLPTPAEVNDSRP